jgi:hypothetical protein
MTPESSTAGFDHASTTDVNLDFSSAGVCTWLADVLRQLDAIRNLPSGWDSHGGDAIAAEIIAAAERLARNLARFSQVPRPVVSPTSAGGIQFEWDANGAYFEVHLEDSTEAQCYFESQSPTAENEFTFHDGDDVDILARLAARVSGS